MDNIITHTPWWRYAFFRLGRPLVELLLIDAVMKLKVINDEGCRNSHSKLRYRAVLSIAGSDSSGGAGIQADLKTYSALGVYGATAITAVTAQNTLGVYAVESLSPTIVREQIVAVMEDIAPSVVKIGMLANADVANAVADTLSHYQTPIVLDPVMVSSSGHRLLSVEAEEVVKLRLLPMSQLITPNIPEMIALTHMPLSTFDEKLAAADYLLSLGAQSLLLKGGHEDGDTKTDILYRRTESGIATSYFTSATITTKNIHGTGCTLSSAIAAYMARGLVAEEAVRRAKEYIAEAIKMGAGVSVGRGFGPVNHLFNPQKMLVYEER